MLSEGFRVPQRKNIKKKRAEQSKNKECKKRYHKKSPLRKFIKYL